MGEESDPLDELFVDENETVSNELLRDILIDYVQFSKEGRIHLLPNFYNLTHENKMLIYLLSKKVIKIKFSIDELTSPKEIREVTGLTIGNVNPSLMSLAKKNLVRNIKGNYFIPNYAIQKIKEIINSKQSLNSPVRKAIKEEMPH